MRKQYLVLSMVTVLLVVVAAILIACTAYKVGTSMVAVSSDQTPKQHAVIDVKPIPLPLATDVEAKLNAFRVSKGLPAFNSEVSTLDEAAQARAEGMCIDNDWSHAKDWDVLQRYYSYSYAGENLYYGSIREGQATDAIETWANSPKHFENMMRPFTEIGIGVKFCPGFQSDPNAVIITNYFGVPR